MSTTTGIRFYPVIKCDGCGTTDPDEDQLYDNAAQALASGQGHDWWFGRAGDRHFCDDCWCEECIQPAAKCAHAETTTEQTEEPVADDAAHAAITEAHLRWLERRAERRA